MTSRERSSSKRSSAGRSDQWLWALLSFTGWLAATGATMPIATAISPEASVRLDLAIWMVLTMVLSLAIVVASARVVFGAWPRVGPVALAVSGVGGALAIAEELLLHEWAEARLGYYDAQLVWWTASLSGLVIATSIAAFGTFVAPRGARIAPLACQAVSALAIVLVLATNIDGLADGIRPESVPLGIGMALCGIFAVGVTAWAVLAGRAENEA